MTVSLMVFILSLSILANTKIHLSYIIFLHKKKSLTGYYNYVLHLFILLCAQLVCLKSQ